MKLALYKGPPVTLAHWLGHWAVRIGTWSRYSHAELVFDGVCWSSTYIDRGIRGKVLDLNDGRWDTFPIQGDEGSALAWFKEREGQPYDWPGLVRFLLPFVRQRAGAYFCSEAVAAALGMQNPSKTTPQDLKDALT